MFRYLIKLSPEDNANRYYRMIQQDDIFVIEMGRIGATAVKMKRPMKLWDATLQDKLKEGYVDRTNCCTETNSKFAEIKDSEIRDFMNHLQRCAGKELNENYVDADAVTAEMILDAQKEIIKISKAETVNDANKHLIKLFTIVPRKMKNVENYLATSLKDVSTVVEREQDLINVLSNNIDIKEKVSPKETILDALHLSIRKTTSSEDDTIKKFLSDESRGLFKRAYRVINEDTERNFNHYVKKHNIKNIHYLYHGSKNANYLGLLSTGPKLNPNAPVTGKMFGQGIYLANRAKKSINYTDLRGSYWNHGKSDTAYLAVYKVAYKNARHESMWSYELGSLDAKKIKPYDALFAHKGGSLINDEIIVYNEHQLTIQYIIELKA